MVSRLDYSNGISPLVFEQAAFNRTQLLISSSDADVKKKDFDFQIKIVNDVQNIKAIGLTRVLIPLIPNITAKNNQIKMSWDGNVSKIYTIPVGFYTVTRMCNILTSVINAGFADETVPFVDTVSVSFDNSLNVFTIRSIGNYDISFLDCSFITYGINCCNFSIGDPDTTIVSGRASMIYTRYISINSKAITNGAGKAYGFCGASGVIDASSSLGFFDVGHLYTVNDFNDGAIFTNNYRDINLIEGPIFNLASDQYGSRKTYNRIPQFCDFKIYDEFGNILSDCFDVPVYCILLFTTYY